jgi:hypothetical protein
MDKARVSKASVADFSPEVQSPVLSICQVTDRGLVFTSAEVFEIGHGVELGFHVRYHEELIPSRVRSEFITCEGQVVGCMLCAGADGLPVYEVTLLFTGFKRGDSQALASFTQLRPADSLLHREALGLN